MRAHTIPLLELQVKLQDMRAKLPDLVDPHKDDDDQQQQHNNNNNNQGQQHDQQDDQQRQHNQHQQQHEEEGYGDFDDLDDDELLELQAQPAQQVAMVRLCCCSE